MYNARDEYRHRPYRSEKSGSGALFVCMQIYIIVFTLGYFSKWLCDRPSLQFHTIVVQGNHALAAADLARVAVKPTQGKFLWLWNKDNLAFYSTSNVEKALLALDPRIATADVRASKNTILVSVREYMPTYRYCVSKLSRAEGNVLKLPTAGMPELSASGTPAKAPEVEVGDESEPLATGTIELPHVVPIDAASSDCFWADERGFVFAHAPDYSGSPMLTVTESDPSRTTSLGSSYPLGQFIFDQTQLEHLGDLIDEVNGQGSVEVHSVTRLADGDALLDVGYPWDIAVNLTNDPHETAQHIGLALKELGDVALSDDSRLTIVDVRFGDKVFYK